MNPFQEFNEQGAWDIVRRADAVMKASESREALFHGVRIMLEPILEDLESIEDGQGGYSLSDWQDEVEACQARMGSVLHFLDFVEGYYLQQAVEDHILHVFLAAHDLLKLAKLVIDDQVKELYSRPAAEEWKPAQPSAPELSPSRARRQEVAA